MHALITLSELVKATFVVIDVNVDFTFTFFTHLAGFLSNLR